MAKIIGEAGGYLAVQYRNKFGKLAIYLICSVGGIAFVAGFQARMSSWWAILLTLAAYGVGLFFLKRAEKFGDEALNYKKGAQGELATAAVLVDLPDDYVIMHDLTHPSFSGNLDHVVVGPTGVFVLDTKNWRGTVALGENGGLLLNDKPTDKPVALNLARNAAFLKDNLKLLTGIDILWVQAVLVFPRAFVKWDVHGKSSVELKTTDDLTDYLKRTRPNRTFDKAQVGRIAKALEALRHMQPTANAPSVPPAQAPTAPDR